MSGGQQNKDEEIVKMVARMNELKEKQDLAGDVISDLLDQLDLGLVKSGQHNGVFFGGASGGMGVANMGIFCQRAGCWLRGTCGLVKINLNNSCWTRPDIFGCIVGNILNLGGILTLNRHLRFKSKQFGLKLVWILLQILPTRILGNYKLKAFNITRCPAVHHRQSGNSIRDSSQWCPEMFDG